MAWACTEDEPEPTHIRIPKCDDSFLGTVWNFRQSWDADTTKMMCDAA